jgi:hypothetical protein
MDFELQDDFGPDPLAFAGSEPLVPILRVDKGKVDPITLATWHEALSNTLGVEVPHDLMGLWLYPVQGGSVLLGPAALAQDELEVPIPSPHLKPEQLAHLEEVVTRAGYQSASCLPVRFGKRDVALFLVADLQGDRYGPMERVVLQCVAQRIAPMLGRIAREWTPAEGTTSRQQERIAGLLQTVANANREGSTPQQFLAAISRGLAPLLPHEHIELLVPDELGARYLRLGEHPGGPLWFDPSLVVTPEQLDIAGIFGGRSRLLVLDSYEDDRWPRGFLTAEESGGADLRSIAGARMSLRSLPPAYLLVGSIGPDLYGAEDVELLVLLSGLILPQIAGFLRGPSQSTVAQGSGDKEKSAELLLSIAGWLATASEPGIATQFVASEAAKLLPFDHLAFALKLDGERVAVLHPGERNATLTPSLGTPLARILRGDDPEGIFNESDRRHIIVPLRGSGRVHGAMVFGATDAVLNLAHLGLAQQLADIVASHLELLRRAAIRTPPTVPRLSS